MKYNAIILILAYSVYEKRLLAYAESTLDSFNTLLRLTTSTVAALAVWLTIPTSGARQKLNCQIKYASGTVQNLSPVDTIYKILP